MRQLALMGMVITLVACGPNQQEIDNITTLTCNILAETSSADGARRIKEINTARKMIGAAPFLGSDTTIKESLEWDLCTELVSDDPNYFEKVKSKKVAKAQQAAVARQNLLNTLKTSATEHPLTVRALKGDRGYAEFEFHTSIDIAATEMVSVKLTIGEFKVAALPSLICYEDEPARHNSDKLFTKPFKPHCKANLFVSLNKDAYDRLRVTTSKYGGESTGSYIDAIISSGDYDLTFEESSAE